MCNYQKVNGKEPCCIHECDLCMWHDEDEEEQEFDDCITTSCSIAHTLS